MSFTVTATGSPGAHVDCYLLVKVLTGATEAGGAVASVHNANATAPNTSITPNGTNSLILWDATADAAATFTLESNNALYGTTIADGDGWAGGFASYTGTVTSGTPVTVGVATTTSSDDSTICAYEVKASGGSTPSVDASSPAQVTASTTCTTAAFTPPAGSVMVAMFLVSSTGAANASGTISDTSGLGLTWTARGVLATAPDQVALIWTTTVPAAGAAVSSSGTLRTPFRTPGPTGPLRQLTAPATPAAPQTFIATATIAGAGAVSDVVTQGVIATVAGAGAVTGNVTQAATATLAGAGAISTVVTQIAPATAAGAGVVTDVVTQIVTATIAGAGAVTATASVTGPATAAIAGAGAVSAVVTQGVIAAPAGLGAVTATTVQGTSAGVSGAATVTDVVTQAVIASTAGAGAVTANANVLAAGATATLTGAGAVAAVVTQITGATAAGAAVVAAKVVQIVPATVAGAGAVSASASVILKSGPGTVTVADRQLDTVLAGDRLAQTCTLTDAVTATVTIADRLAQTVTIADQATGTVTIGDQLP